MICVSGGTLLALVLLAAAAWRLAVGDMVTATVLAAPGAIIISRAVRGGGLVHHDHSRAQRCPTCDTMVWFELPAAEYRCDSCGTTHAV